MQLIKELTLTTVMVFSLLLLTFQNSSLASYPFTTYEISKNGKIIRILGEYDQTITCEYDSSGRNPKGEE